MVFLAFTTGLLGSWHCALMCGPLAMSVPIPKNKRWLGFLLYHSGRLTSYASMGLIISMVGIAFQFGAFQQQLSLFAGITMIAFLMIPGLSFKLEAKIQSASFIRFLRKAIGQQFSKRTILSAFIVGVLNGILPCGLVYLGLAGAFIAATHQQSIIHMVSFGVGTLPIFIGLIVFGNLARFPFKFKPQLIVQWMMCLIFLYRGIAVDLPEIAAMIQSVQTGVITICGK